MARTKSKSTSTRTRRKYSGKIIFPIPSYISKTNIPNPVLFSPNNRQLLICYTPDEIWNIILCMLTVRDIIYLSSSSIEFRYIVTIWQSNWKIAVTNRFCISINVQRKIQNFYQFYKSILSTMDIVSRNIFKGKYIPKILQYILAEQQVEIDGSISTIGERIKDNMILEDAYYYDFCSNPQRKHNMILEGPISILGNKESFPLLIMNNDQYELEKESMPMWLSSLAETFLEKSFFPFMVVLLGGSMLPKIFGIWCETDNIDIITDLENYPIISMAANVCGMEWSIVGSNINDFWLQYSGHMTNEPRDYGEELTDKEIFGLSNIVDHENFQKMYNWMSNHFLIQSKHNVDDCSTKYELEMKRNLREVIEQKRKHLTNLTNYD